MLKEEAGFQIAMMKRGLRAKHPKKSLINIHIDMRKEEARRKKKEVREEKLRKAEEETMKIINQEKQIEEQVKKEVKDECSKTEESQDKKDT